MIHKYEESLVDIETLLKIDPTNKAAKNELVLIQKMKEDMVSRISYSLDQSSVNYQSEFEESKKHYWQSFFF